MKNRHKYCDAEGRFRGIGVTKNRTFIHLAIGRSKDIGRQEGGRSFSTAFVRQPVRPMRLQYLLRKRGVSPSLGETALQPGQSEHARILNSKKGAARRHLDYSMNCPIKVKVR